MFMRLGKKFIGAAVFTALAFGGANAQTKVVVDPGKKYQHFEGWGTSLCWWAELAGGWSEANYTKLLGAIADPDSGLGYNIFRYNIGGGDQPGHNHLTKGDGGAAIPGYKPTEKGDFDWTADPTQRNILFGLAKKVKNPIFEAFSNSPPWWMTNSGCVSGGVNGADNLKSDYFDDFADYLSEVAKHFKEEWGITFRTVEPFNEPSAGWWKANGDQEGCGFKNKQSEMIVELGKALKKKGLFPETSVSAADESNIGDALARFNSYSDEAKSYMFQVNTHSYSGYDSRGKLYNAAFANDKRIWQSESGPLHRSGDLDITLWMADVILHDLRDMHASAWVDWQLSDPAENWRTITANHKSQTFSYAPRYYMHAAFSRAIRPGSRFIDSDNSNTLAAIREDGSLVLVVLNTGSTDAKYTFDLSKFDAVGTKAKVNRFTLPAALKADADIAISGGSLNVTVAAQSLVTLIIDDVKGEGKCAADTIIPYVKIHDGSWNETTEITVNPGDSLVIGPHPWDGGRWTWSGPDNFYYLGREVRFKNLQWQNSGYYKTTFVNGSGCESKMTFKLVVNDPEHPFVEPDTNVVDTSTADTSVVDTTGRDTTNSIIVLQATPQFIHVSRSGGDLHITAPVQPMQLTIHDLQGVLLTRRQINGPATIPLGNAPRKGYIIQLRNQSGRSMYLKVVR
ncbi:glycoside hydrolase [Fibrobacter sp. UWH6]|uniref:glycoside hydrolase family 30 protein n=2 Tax=unclassified Fibrobacter TaxID=2634177 RepID=UPI00091E6D52|nr:glycoside hydrolase [Fibrobacter sp. UWH6]SHL66685.1 O-Glycosyl hydrolase [Fibrobacter sp. UWH6]